MRLFLLLDLYNWKTITVCHWIALSDSEFSNVTLMALQSAMVGGFIPQMSVNPVNEGIYLTPGWVSNIYQDITSHQYIFPPCTTQNIATRSPWEDRKASATSFHPIIIKGKVNLSRTFFSLNIFFFFGLEGLFTHLYIICFLFKFQSNFGFYNMELAFKVCYLTKENYRS